MVNWVKQAEDNTEDIRKELIEETNKKPTEREELELFDMLRREGITEYMLFAAVEDRTGMTYHKIIDKYFGRYYINHF